MNTSFWPEFHQVAIYVPWSQHDTAVDMFKLFGYSEWITDEADLIGVAGNEAMETHARMSFNYEFLGGKELEIVSYEGDSHHHRAGRADQMFISHMSVHVDNANGYANRWAWALGVDVVHSFDTFNHRNPALIESGKTFRERIIGTRHIIGFDVKFIERLIP